MFLFLGLPIVRSAFIFECGLLFGLGSYRFSSLVPLPSVFPLFIYLSVLTFRVSFHYVDVVIVMHHILS